MLIYSLILKESCSYCNNPEKIQCKRQRGSKNDKPPLGRPRITTPLEDSDVIVTSAWRNRFMAAWKLLKRLKHATSTRISVHTARNRLRGARMIFEFWNFNNDIVPFVWFWWRKEIYFQNVLLKLFTFVRNYINFMLSKVFDNIKTVLQNHCTEVCTD